MTVQEATKGMAGFKAWYNSIIKPVFKWTGSAKDLKAEFFSEYLNTNEIEIPARLTKSGNPERW